MIGFLGRRGIGFQGRVRRGKGILGIQRMYCLFVSLCYRFNRDDLQSPSVLSLPRRRVKSVSKNEEIGAKILDVPSFSDSLPVERSNRVSSPATVGMKNGALSAALGASFGLLRCYQSAPYFSVLKKGLTRIVSRLRRVCQRDRGINESVSKPSDNCSGVTKISTGSGAPICSTSSISRYQP